MEASAGEASGPKGFTLVEILVTLVLVGIVGAATVGVLLRQNYFYGQTDDIVFANQSIRGTADLVPSELRTVSGADVVYSDADSLQVRYTVTRGIVCRVDSDIVDFYVFDEDTNANLSSDRGTAYRNPFADPPDLYEYADGFDAYASGSASSTAQTNCVDAGSPDDGAADQYRRVDWTPSDIPVQGAYLRIYGFLSYHFGPSSFASGTALWRNGDELVAPFEPGSTGLVYRVCPPSESCTWHSSVSDNSDQRVIERFRIRATATGEGANRYDVARDLQLDVPLRN